MFEFNISRQNRNRLLGLAAVALLLLLLPIPLPYTIKAPGKVLPAQQWILTRGADGRLMTQLIDHRSGINKRYSVRQFERGDAVSFALDTKIAAGGRVAAGDTLATLVSNETDRQLIHLQGELARARATESLSSSGQKESVVGEARSRLEHEKQQAEEQRKILARKKTLFERGLIPKEEYELAQGRAKLNEINIAIAGENLRSVESGDRQGQIELVRSQVSALEEEIRVLQRRRAAFSLVSPISGAVSAAFSGDTLLVVSDTTGFVVLMPVRLRDKRYVRPGQRVEIEAPDAGHTAGGTLEKLENRVYLLGGEQMFLATVTFKVNNAGFAQGMLVSCSVDCGAVFPRVQAGRFLQTLLR